MKLTEITTERLRELPEQELGSLHRRVHMLAGQDQTDESLETLLERAHDLVVAEWVRRGNEHKTPLEFKKAFEADTPTLRFCNDVAGMLPFICGPRVLEVGYGDGRLSKMLAEAGFEVGGVEKADNVGDVEGCETMEGDCAKLPFEDGAYNTVLSKHVLEHLEDPARGLAETCRVASDVALHVVPLGARACAGHKHDFDWDSVNKLLDTVPHPAQVKRLGYGTVLLAVMKRGGFPGWLKDYGIIPLVPGYVSVVGSQLKSSEPGDCDVLIREYMTNPTVELAVRNRVKDSVCEKLHWIYAPAGPHGNSFTLYDLALVPRDLHRAFDDLDEAVKSVAKNFTLMRRFQPPKPRHAEYLVGDGLERLMKEYVEPILSQGGSVAVEEKLNGFRAVGMHDGKEALVFFEGDKRNRAKQFPLLAAELGMVAPVAFDMEVGGIQKSGRPLPRKNLAILSSSRNVVEREFADGVSLVAHAFDCMWGGEDLTDKTWVERRKVLEAKFSGADFKILKLVPTHISKSLEDVRDRIEAVSERIGSEGAVVKDTEAKYPVKPEGAASVAFDGMAKIKGVAEYVAQVLSAKETKAGTYSYEIGVSEKGANSLGNAMNTGIKAGIGDHLSMTTEEVIPEYDEKAKAWGVSATVQMVQGKTDAAVDTVESMIRAGQVGNVLQADDAMLRWLESAGLAKAVEFLKAEAGDGERGAGPEGRIDFVEGMTGRGVFQEHWMGFVNREDAEAGHGTAGSIHTDFRMLPDGATSWQGGELFTPGTPGKRSKLLDYKSGEKIMANFKTPHAGERPERGELPVVRGPKEWMTIASRKPAVLNPGEPGATSQKWARIEQADTFAFVCGTQDDHYKEFKLTFDKHKDLSGRWILMYAPLQQGRFWLMTKPKEQRMDAEREAKTKGVDVVEFVRELAEAVAGGTKTETLIGAWSE